MVLKMNRINVLVFVLVIIAKNSLAMLSASAGAASSLESDEKISVSVNFLTGRRITVDVNADCTVGELKKSLSVQEGISCYLRFIFETKQLEDERSLAQYNIRSGSIINAILMLRPDSDLDSDREDKFKIDAAAAATIPLERVGLVEHIIRLELRNYLQSSYGTEQFSDACCNNSHAEGFEHCGSHVCRCCGDTQRTPFFMIRDFLTTDITPGASLSPADDQVDIAAWEQYLAVASAARADLDNCIATLFRRRPSLEAILQEIDWTDSRVSTLVSSGLKIEIERARQKISDNAVEEELMVKPAANT